jgi:hypothetical protein
MTPSLISALGLLLVVAAFWSVAAGLNGLAFLGGAA